MTSFEKVEGSEEFRKACVGVGVPVWSLVLNLTSLENVEGNEGFRKACVWVLVCLFEGDAE